MKEKKPQKQLLQTAMLSLLSAVMVLAFASPSLAALDCASCHGGGSLSGEFRPVDAAYRNITSGGFVGNHRTHMGSGVGTNACVPCHGAAPTINSHRDGQIAIVAGQTYTKGTFFNQTSVPALGSCSTATCHAPYAASAASPTWGTTGLGCATCHTGGGLFAGNGAPVTGSHDSHMTYTSTYAGLTGAACATCHVSPGGANHIDSNVNVAAATGYPATVARHTIGSGYSTCTTASCHANTYGTGTVATPTWGNPQGCATCHAASPTTGDHPKHIAAVAYNGNLCASCHAGAVAGSNGGTVHGDGNIDVTGTLLSGYPANVTKHLSGSGYSTCTTACHSTSLTAIATPVWGTTATCSSCHATSPTTGDHPKHLAATAYSGNLCASCHAGAISGSNAGTAHFDANIDVTGTLVTGYPANVAKHAEGSGYSTCTTTCHSTNLTAIATPVWGTTATCSSCHATSPTTGDHPKHLAAVAFGGNLCANCHAGAISGSNGGTAHFDANIDVNGTLVTGYPANVAKHAEGSGYSTCTTVCHSTTATAVVTPVWGTTATCSSCHATAPTTGDHPKHLASVAYNGNLCASCHAGAISGSNAGTAHFDGNVDVTGTLVTGYPVNVTRHAEGSGYSTCTTTCHSTSLTAIATPVWGTTATCSSCHATSPTTGDHPKHLAATAYSGNLCASCHTGAISGSNAGTAHFDANIDVAGTLVAGYPANVAKHAEGSGYSTCTTSCHSTSLTAIATPVWGTTATCSSCHATSPTTGDHPKHLAAVAYNGNLCASCHAGAISGSNAGTAHFDANIDVTGTLVTGYTANVAKHAEGSGYSTCTTTCHSTSLTAIATPTWGTTATCSSCHATSPTTGTHTEHMSRTIITCGDCHTGAISGSNGGTAHFDGNIDVTGALVTGYPVNVAKHAVGSGYGSCTTTCHNSPKATFVATAKTWGAASLNCDGCHGYPGGANATISSTHPAVAAGSCNSCHNNVKTGSTFASTNTIFNNLQLHMNKVVEGGACDSCHGYPPVQSKPTRLAGTLGTQNNYSGARFQNYSGGGGVHDVAGHLNPLIKPSAGFGTIGSTTLSCATCHATAGANHNQTVFSTFSTANVQVIVDSQYKFDKNRAIVYNAKQKGPGAKNSGTCTNVSCHFQKTPIWSNQTYTQTH